MINEVMYDPEINDNYYEWIELYNPTNQSINVTDWTITDNYATDFLEANFDHGNGSLTIPTKGYAIITDHGTYFYDNFTIPNETIRLYIDDSAIGNGLGNSGDMLILKNNESKIIDAIEWIENFTDVEGEPANSTKEGYSLSRFHEKDTNNSIDDFYEGTIPTPGDKNIFIEKGKTQISCNETDIQIRKNENLEIILNVKNVGEFFDNITLKINYISFGWSAELQKENIFLNSSESESVSLIVSPCKFNGCDKGKIIILAESEKEINISDEITLNFEIFAPDLTIKNIKIYNEEDLESIKINEGEILRIKAFLKNQGPETATNVIANFYLDKISNENFLGEKFYETIENYQKYPSILFDTHKIAPGKHKIYVIADEQNSIDEIDETNNALSIQIEIIDTHPNEVGKKILITEIYYHSRPALYDEFISINNPTDSNCDISGWYLTNEPDEIKSEQTKIVFPNDTIISAKSKIVLSESAKNYSFETGVYPDFEYNVDSFENISQMVSDKKFIMSNSGAQIALKDFYNHTIDLVSYGNKSLILEEWAGKSIDFSGEGVILKRNMDEFGNLFDSNTSIDWENPKRYLIGQSNLIKTTINCTGEITTFVSPDSSFEQIRNVLSQAYESIYLNVYEFSDYFLCDELINALKRNVSVFIFLEGSPIGGISDEEKYVLNRIKNYGGNIRFLAGNSNKKIYTRYVFDHAKYLIIDNLTTIIESCNFVNTGIPKNPTFGNREWGIIIRNSSVAKYFLDVFLQDFNPNRCDSFPADMYNLSFPENFYVNKYVSKGNYKTTFEEMSIYCNFSVIPVFSPDTSYEAIYEMINSANETIYVEQLYIYKNWSNKISPFVKLLADKAKNGVDVKVILNYNPTYNDTNEEILETKKYLEENNAQVKFIFTNWLIFTNVHNKGVIVDNKSVLISSINWNENSFLKNREAGVIIENKEVAKYYSDVFFYDWDLEEKNFSFIENETKTADINYKNTIYIVVIFTLTFALIARDWRKRQWT